MTPGIMDVGVDRTSTPTPIEVCALLDRVMLQCDTGQDDGTPHKPTNRRSEKG